MAAAATAAAAAATAIIVAHDLSRHPPVVVHEQPGSRGPSSPALAAGAPVGSAQLDSDPVFVDPSRGFALATGIGGGASERLAATTDGGATWRLAGAAFPVAGTFTTLLFTDVQHGFVFGPAGLVVTTDGGQSWSQPALTGEVQRVIPAYGDVWAILTTCGGPPGGPVSCPVQVEISADGGLTWRPTVPPPLTEGSAGGAVLGRVTAGKAYVLTWGSPESGLVRTTDDGQTWQRVRDPCSGNWAVEDMAALAGGDLWLVCGAPPPSAGPVAGEQVKAVYRTDDGGRHWRLAGSTGFVPGAPAPVGTLTLSGVMSQFATVSPVQAWLGVAGVGVLETRDGGRIWWPVAGLVDPSPTGVGVTFIRSPDGSVLDGWALAFGYAVWRTTDADHWRQVAGG
jgi:photosystem II stability/assembly factor-like uncharacterized protein